MTTDELLEQLGGRFRCLKLHSNGNWTAEERHHGKDRNSLSLWGNTPQIALTKLLEALEDEPILEVMDDWLIKGKYNDNR